MRSFLPPPTPGAAASASPLPPRTATWIALLAYMALLTYLSHQTSLPTFGCWFAHQDKGEHFLAYAVLGVLSYRALPGTGRRRLLAAICLAWAFGASDELHQAWVPGRDASAWDWVADALGAGTGTAVAVHALRWRNYFLSWLKRSARAADQ